MFIKRIHNVTFVQFNLLLLNLIHKQKIMLNFVAVLLEPFIKAYKTNMMAECDTQLICNKLITKIQNKTLQQLHRQP